MSRLKEQLLTVPRLASANIHASLLPAYRGRSPIFWALRHDEKFAGLTIHTMDAHLDTGGILYQVKVRIRRNDSVASLYDRVIEKSLSLVARLIADAARGKLRPRTQSEVGASYFSSAKEADFRLDWHRPAEELRRWIIATPGQCFSDICGRRVFFLGAAIAPEKTEAKPGTLARIGRGSVLIAASDGMLRIKRVKCDSQEPMLMSAFCRRAGLSVGAEI